MSNELKIITNNVPRDVIEGYELSAKERAYFDWYSDDEIAEHTFIRYKGELYDLSDFMRCAPERECTPQMKEAGFQKWDGYQGDSFFSGVLCRYVGEDMGRIIMGRYMS